MISGEKIVLRAPELTDVQVIYKWENDPSLRIFSRSQVPLSTFAIEQYILSLENNPFRAGEVRFMAETIESKVLIGHVDLFDIDALHRRAGVGILIEEGQRGKGFGKEILNILERWCKNSLNLHQLWCTISTNNVESIHLFTSDGFRQTGKREHWILEGNQWKDELFFQKKI